MGAISADDTASLLASGILQPREQAVARAVEHHVVALDDGSRLALIPLGRGASTILRGEPWRRLTTRRIRRIEGKARVGATSARLRLEIEPLAGSGEVVLLWQPPAGVELSGYVERLGLLFVKERTVLDVTVPLDFEDPADRFTAWMPWDPDPAGPGRASLTVDWPSMPEGLVVNGTRSDKTLRFECAGRTARPAWGFLPGRWASARRGRLNAFAGTRSDADRLADLAAAILPGLEADLGRSPHAAIDVIVSGPGRCHGRAVLVEDAPTGAASDWSPRGPAFALAHELSHLAWPATGDHHQLEEGVAQLGALLSARRLAGEKAADEIESGWRAEAKHVKGPLLSLTDPFRREPSPNVVYAAQPLALLELARIHGTRRLLDSLRTGVALDGWAARFGTPHGEEVQ